MTETARPLVTFALFAYNQEKYIREAVEGAFSQTYEPLEIILSDDCSSDRTYEIMQEMVAAYKGPHRVVVRQSVENRGLASHVNAVMEAAEGEIIVVAAGDDVSLPQRCALSVELLERHPAAAEVLLSAEIIDAVGNRTGKKVVAGVSERLQSLSDLMNWRHKTMGAGRAFRRDVFEFFGPLAHECPTEDTPFLLRSLMLGGSILSGDIGLRYRSHGENLSGAASMRKMNVGAIHVQYSSDISRAEKKNILGAQVAKELRLWIGEDLKVRNIKSKLRSSERLSINDLIAVVRIPSFGARDLVKSVRLLLLGGRGNDEVQ